MAYTAWMGIPQLLTRLNAKIQQIQGRTLMGLIRGAAIIKKTMDTTPPTIPIDTGNMRHSWFIVTNNGGVRAGRHPGFLPGKYNDRDIGRLNADHAKAIAESISLIRGKEPAIALGFSAYYTLWVHENVGLTFHTPGSGAKFFESALRGSAKEVLAMIKMEAKVR